MNRSDGISCLLWDDCWNGQPLKLSFPELFSFTSKPSISLHQAALLNDISSLFNLPLLVQAFEQFHQINEIISSFHPSVEHDVWHYIWGNSTFSSKKAYRQLIGSRKVAPIFNWIWKSSCQPKHKVFFWLLIQDRLSSRNLLRRRNMHLPSYNCVVPFEL